MVQRSVSFVDDVDVGVDGADASNVDESTAVAVADAGEPRKPTSSPRLQMVSRRAQYTKSLSDPSGLRIARNADSEDLDGSDSGRGVAATFMHSLHRAVQENREAAATVLKEADAGNIETLEKLGSDYLVTTQEHFIAYRARVKSTAQCLYVALAFLAIVETIGVTVCIKKGGYQLNQALLFTHYTMTTSGYGNYPIPDDTGYQIFLCFLMFAGVAVVPIVVSQVYQYFAIHVMRAERKRDKSVLGASSADTVPYLESRSPRLVDQTPLQRVYALSQRKAAASKRGRLLDATFGVCNRCLVMSSTPWGRFFSVSAYLMGLLLIGAVGVVLLEGVTFIQGFYLASYTMTTVGYGDIPVTKDGTIWFCVFWLPFNVSFVSIYMGNLVRVYAWVANWNIARINNQICATIYEGNEKRANALSTTDGQPVSAVGENADSDTNEEGAKASAGEPLFAHVRINTMKDVINFVRANLIRANDCPDLKRVLTLKSSLESSLPFAENGARNPSFVLQVLTQERLAKIIATEVAGYQSQVHIRGQTATLTVDTLTLTSKRWCVPALARDAFVTVAFEALLYVGENALVTRGADSIFELSPGEFHELCLPFLAALGDAGTMEGWLAQTESLVHAHLT